MNNSSQNISDKKVSILTKGAKELDSYEDYFLAGHIKYFLGDYRDALLNYQKFLQLNPSHSVTRFYIYKVALLLGEEKIAKEIINWDGYQYHELVSFLGLLNSDNPIYESLPILKKITNLNPNNSDTWILWLNSGWVHEKKNQYLEAQQIYSEALYYQQNYNVNYFEGSLWFRLGRIYQFGLKNKTQNELIEIYNNSEKSGVFLNKSDESNLHWYKGEVFRSFHDKQYEEAMLIEYDQALIIQPDNYSILCALGNIYLYDLQNYSLALDNFEKAINVNQENALAYYGLGETYLFLDNQSMAIKNYQLAISKDKNFSDAIKKLENLQSNPD